MNLTTANNPRMLASLLASIDLDYCGADKQIEGLALDSRKVEPGGLFIALKGAASDGRFFIDAAIDRGAVAVLAENDDGFVFADYSVPVVEIPNLSKKVSKLAGEFYQRPSSQLKLIGVTGTNGKTTCVQLLMQLISALGETCASLGTMGYGFDGESLKDFGLTTPDALSCQQILAELLAGKAKTVAMEVSSHAIDQGRVQAVDFEGAVLTNITRDHLDYHGNFDNYQNTKKQLFTRPELKFAILNLDDENGLKFFAELAGSQRKIIGYTLSEQTYLRAGSKNAVLATEVKLGANGICAQIRTPWGEGTLQSRLIGEFNVYNLLAVLSVVCGRGFAFEEVLCAMQELRPVKGRLQSVTADNADILVCIDYAHTPDALQKALNALRNHCTQKLWVVFGCGGDRDKGKRPQMASIAESMADHVVITSDNPRSESPQSIIDDVMAGIREAASHVESFVDREQAIAFAINKAGPGDLVLVAGKGHEDYQIIGDKKRYFDDYLVAQKYLRQRQSGGEVTQ